VVGSRKQWGLVTLVMDHKRASRRSRSEHYSVARHFLQADSRGAEKATELTPHRIETEMRLISDKAY